MFEFFKNIFLQLSETDDSKQSNIEAIALIGTVVAWLALPAYILMNSFTRVWQFEYLIYNDLALAVGLSLAYILARTKIRYISAWLTALFVEITFIAANFFVSGLGIILAVIALTIIINIALQSLPTQQAIYMIITAVLTTAGCIVIDLLNIFPDRIASPQWIQQVIIVFGGVVILFLTINYLETLQFSSLQTQLSIAFLLIALLPLVTVLISSFITQTQTLRTIQDQELRRISSEISDGLDSELINLTQAMETHANLPAIKQYLTDENSTLLDTFLALSNQNPFILSYGLVDTQGKTLLDIRTFRVNENNANTGWFRETMTRRAGYVSELIYDTDLLRPVFYVSAPVFNEAQEIIAVVRAEYDAEFLRKFLIDKTSDEDKSLTVLVVDRNNIIVAHSAQPELQQKTLSLLRQEQISALQATGQLPPGTAESNSAMLTKLEESLNAASSDDFFSAQLANNTDSESTTTTNKIISKNWTVVVGKVYSFDMLNILNINLTPILVVTVVMLAMIVTATNTSKLITSPINRLTLVAKEVGQGNLNAKTGITRHDEIGTLANIFDETTAQLRGILQNLEARVSQRTNELAVANTLVTKKADQLKTVSNVANAINNLQSLKLLLPQIANEINKSFGYYHVGIFLLDPSGQYAFLSATNSEGGQRMLERGHKLRVGQVGIVGYATGVGKARIALDVGDDATFFNNPDLPETHSEMALPLKSGGNIIGALDIQSKEISAFSKDDIEILSLLADQISIAIENSRLFEETRTALAEAQLVFNKTIQASWSDITETEKSAYRFNNGQITEITQNETNQSDENHENLVLPISIRGEKLGFIEIKTAQQREWNEQDVRIFQSVVDRLGYALENARLFRDAQRLVSKERVIGEIANRIGHSVNLDDIMQIAVEELGHIITDSEITIQLGE
jgi:GAF domain-containing protein/HAMP domain-containing protein